MAALGPVVVSVAVLSTIPLSAVRGLLVCLMSFERGLLCRCTQITDSLAHHAVTYTALSISGYVMIAAGISTSKSLSLKKAI